MHQNCVAIFVNRIILDEIKNISDDENEYKFLKEVLEICGDYSNKTTSKNLKHELEQLIPIYYPLEVNNN
jgi:hypothetical protein